MKLPKKNFSVNCAEPQSVYRLVRENGSKSVSDLLAKDMLAIANTRFLTKLTERVSLE